METGGHEWNETGRAERWLAVRDNLPHGEEMVRVLVEDVVEDRRPRRILDLGTGGGAMITGLLTVAPDAEYVGLDLSGPLLAASRGRFAESPLVSFRQHDLGQPLPSDLGAFDLVVSAWVIHHLPDVRKASLFSEVHELLNPGGRFCNMDLVTSSPAVKERALNAFAQQDDEEDSSDQPASMESQLGWMREAGFESVDCYWKWLFTAMMVGDRPG